METSVQVTPLCGVYNENPFSYLVSVDGFNFLIDCGWDDLFDTNLLEPLSRISSTIDAILLSHPDTLHVGALPYAMKQYGLSVPIYSTEPVCRLGCMTMHDQYHSREQVSDFDLFTLDDIYSTFNSVTMLPYSQNHALAGKGEGIVISPHVAGPLLGGTVWKITKEGEDIIYAVDFNHRKKRHLNATVLESFARPAVMITDAYNTLNDQPLCNQSDQEFLDVITKTLRGMGNVLLPVDTAGRVLELILLLEQYWEEKGLTYQIFYITHLSSSIINYVKSSHELMSDSIAKSFGHTRDNPFSLKHVKILINKSELKNVQDGPKIVLTSMASLEVGYSHEIFTEWANDAKNLVLFTERAQLGTLARILQADQPPEAVIITKCNRVPLVGEELRVYEEEQNRIKEEAIKASLSKEEDANESHNSDANVRDPIVTDASNALPSSEVAVPHGGMHWDNFIGGFVSRSSMHVQVKCSLVNMDFEGCSDGCSISSILAHMAPLRLVLVNGSEDTEHLKQHCLKHVCPHVCAPQVGERVDVTSDLCASKVQASEHLMSNVLFKKLLTPCLPCFTGYCCWVPTDGKWVLWLSTSRTHLVSVAMTYIRKMVWSMIVKMGL